MSELTLTKVAAGDVIADRYDVVTIMGEDELGVTCLVTDRNTRQMLLFLQLSFACDASLAEEIRHVVADLRSISHKSMANLELFVSDGVAGYIGMEYVDGETFEAHLRVRRERGQILGLKAAYSFLAHLCSGLEAVHQAGCAYGSLSPRTILVTSQGRVKMAHYVCAHLASRYLSAGRRDRYFGGVFVAPEVRHTSGAMPTPVSDVYSLGLLFAELMSGLSLEGYSGAPEKFIERLSGISAAVKESLYQATRQDAGVRFKNVAAFKESLKRAVDAPSDTDLSSIVLGVNDLRALTASGDLPALDFPPQKKPDLFDRGEDRISGAHPKTGDPEVWIYQKNGLDYGPFNTEGLLKKLYQDEIHEKTLVYNTLTKKRESLGKIPACAEAVKAYIPVRERNQAEAAARKKRTEKRVKTAGISTVIAGILGVAALISIPIIALSMLAAPEPLALEAAFPKFSKEFELPKMEEFSLNVDEKQAMALFDPKATAAEREAALAAWEAEHRKVFAAKRRAAGLSPMGGQQQDDGIETFSFGGEDGVELPPLLDWEIEEQLMNPRALRRQSDCFVQHSGGRRHQVTVSFAIQQSGSVRNLTTTAQGELNECLVSAFSSLKFRQFGGTIKKVTYPLSY
ncbi:MAG: protein kinase [Proteobacteria bacterium]|nr:protein kinase [Pseudomonadota bacterium]